MTYTLELTASHLELINMAVRELPEKTRAELVAHMNAQLVGQHEAEATEAEKQDGGRKKRAQ